MQHSQTKPGRRGCTKSSTMASPDVGSKKRSVLRNLLSQPARSAFNEGELHASFLTQTCARCNGFARNRRAVTSHRARAVTYCQGARKANAAIAASRVAPGNRGSCAVQL